MRFVACALAAVVTSGLAVSSATAQTYSPSLYAGMQWRMIGPFRGGRTVAVTGVPGEPSLFYIAPVNGGVWKTTDAGTTWQPIFDGQPTGSIGAIAVAPSDRRVIYVGSGEGLQRPDLSTGDGIYKSTDAGATWEHLGLRDGQQIAKIVVDPRDAKRLYVAVLGHPYGANPERGVYRSTDGGQTFARVLYENENAGAIELAMSPHDPDRLYAALWVARRPPWYTGGSYERSDLGSGLFTSGDGGMTWHSLTQGLPTQAQGLGRIGLGIAPSHPSRIYALVDSPKLGGLYRSDDAGMSWKRTNVAERLWGRGDDFSGVTVDPSDPGVVYVANTSVYRSTDGGQTFTAIKGAPGGDDYHTIWIDPANARTILLGSDQGATISVNGGQTWTPWYNQPTAQFFHVSTDDAFLYRVYGGQQESGSVGTLSRGNEGQITFREWRPVGAEEYGYVAPDPLDANIVYGGKVSRFDWRTGQTQDVSPVIVRGTRYRFDRTAPLVFSHVDKRRLYLGANVIFETRDGGRSWREISPDLTRLHPGVPASFALFGASERVEHRGVVYTIAPSYTDGGTLWAGTNDGLIWRTVDDGVHWNDVTPPGMTPWSKVSLIDVAHRDAREAYAAVNRLYLDDLHPYVYRTRDGGRTWQLVTNGLPVDAPVNVVREDPVRAGLLFCGTETSVFTSFDDGDHWQPLQLNLPATSMRDLVVHRDDLVVGTHGRSFWILDDLTPLRQIDASVARSTVHLFTPAVAHRLRRDTNTDTPLPPEVPAGRNPPDGAILDYYLATAAATPLTIEIANATGTIVRRFSSTDVPPTIDPASLEIPTYWLRPPVTVSTGAGMHRFIWDLHEAPPLALAHDYPISAIVHDTPREPLGPLVLPGRYTVRLTVEGRTFQAPLGVLMDPRVPISRADLVAQHDLAESIAAAMNASANPKSEALVRLNARFAELLDIVEGADAAPTVQARATFRELRSELEHAPGRLPER
jgi:photosystem II stability/assembly factor-like uncharacterized protein